ncbi:MAG TPA: TetR/AcrR family transcriptional regulator C-terminal domain-containing protein [Devosiaceae bacterium]|jgi:TetR/AcrR family tetracycline transcriptional repressor
MKLERQKIIDAALDLLNEVGLDQLTTRKLAERLGVQQPALYWHFKNKNALLDAMNEEMMLRGHTRRQPLPGEAWDEFVVENARSFRRALLAFRDGARVHAGNEPSESEMPGSEAQLRNLLDAGFEMGIALRTLIAIGTYTIGNVLEEQATQTRQSSEQVQQVLTRIGTYPMLDAAVRAYMDEGFEPSFENGLQLMLAGLRQHLAEKKTKTAP